MENNCYTGTSIPAPIIEPCSGIYYNSQCVIHESAIPYLDLPANSSVKNIINNLVLALLYKDEQIANQTTIIESLSPKYRSYVALLNQERVEINSGLLVIGNKYKINNLIVGTVDDYDNLVAGTGYSDASGVGCTGGSGTGLTVDVTTSLGGVSNIIIADRGTGYEVGDIITINSGGFNSTFEITAVLSDNFSNVGYVSSDVFTATGTTPTYWGNSTVVIDADASAPIATVMENSIGDIEWTYQSSGRYRAELTGAFTNQKTFVMLQIGESTITSVGVSELNMNYVEITNYSFIDNVFTNTAIEIRVYN